MEALVLYKVGPDGGGVGCKHAKETSHLVSYVINVFSPEEKQTGE